MPPSLEELQKLLPQYEIIKMLGLGGMGAVYQGRQISLDRPVAIKILSAERCDSDQGFAERFKNEARAMGRLNHPHIVGVHDFGETAGGLLYIVMEYVEGTDVARMIASQKRLRTQHAMAIAAHVCDALAYAHERGIIHRDIKPANIMVGYDGVVKVADFGLAKVGVGGEGAGLTRSGVAMGTLHYMAPESLMPGEGVDHRADIYAVGVMLYQMLTGKLPQGMFELPSLQVAGIDPRYDGIIAKALRENRNLRYQSAMEMRADLDGLLTQPVAKAEAGAEARTAPAALPTQARPQRPGGRVYRPPQRNAVPSPAKSRSPGVLMLAALGVLAVLGLGAFLGFKARPRASFGDDLRTREANAGSSSQTPAPEKRPSVGGDGWEPLFPSDSLAGWKGDTAGYHIKDGILSSTATGGDLISEKEYGSFHLKFDLRLSSGANSGIGIWCAGDKGSNKSLGHTGFEIQLIDDASLGGAIRPSQFHGALYGFVAPKYKALNPLGSWNSHEIRMEGTKLTVLINDVTVIEQELPRGDPTFETGIRQRLDFSKRRGHLVLLGRKGPVDFKNVLIKDLGETAAPATSSPPDPAASSDTRDALRATKDTPFVNSLGMKFVPVPISGGPTDGRRVLFSVWETRVQDYEAFVKETRREWRKPDFEQGPTHPAVNVTWDDAQLFCGWLTARDREAGRLPAEWRYRLPSDHEWSCAVGIAHLEDAAVLPKRKSGELLNEFPWGKRPTPMAGGNFGGAETVGQKIPGVQTSLAGYRDDFVFTAPVGSFPQDRLGLCDLSGNVCEMCEDWYDSLRNARVIRGGSWDARHEGQLLSAVRGQLGTPGAGVATVGFRCVLGDDLTASKPADGATSPSVRSAVPPPPGPPATVPPAGPTIWVDTKGRRLLATFKVLQGEEVMLEINGATQSVKMNTLSGESQKLARDYQANAGKGGWAPLFPNNSLAGWKGDTAGYHIDNGILSSTATGGDLISEKEYGSFHLKFDLRLSSGANSGIGVWCAADMGSYKFLGHTGFEIQLIDEAALDSAMRPSQFHGALHGFVAPKYKAMNPLGSWNSHEIRMEGTKLTVIINGVTVIDQELPRGDPVVQGSRRHPIDLSKRRGHLVFLGMKGPVDFRNMQIKDLDPAVSSAIGAPPALEVKPGPPTAADLTGVQFQFSWKTVGGSAVIAVVSLSKDGSIVGSRSPNEARWELRGDRLVFRNSSGRDSTAFDSFKKVNGKWLIEGTFLLRTGVTHILQEK